MDPAGWYMKYLSGLHLNGAQIFFGRSRFEKAFACLEEDRLFFFLVILEAQAFASLNEEYFTDVVLGLGPENLVAPRFFSPVALMNPLF